MLGGNAARHRVQERSLKLPRAFAESLSGQIERAKSRSGPGSIVIDDQHHQREQSLTRWQAHFRAPEASSKEAAPMEPPRRGPPSSPPQPARDYCSAVVARCQMGKQPTLLRPGSRTWARH